jgi:ATP-dependent 26S proteasome regulatory subunit
MEVDEKPKEEYNDIGGLDKQIEVFPLSCTIFHLKFDRN